MKTFSFHSSSAMLLDDNDVNSLNHCWDMDEAVSVEAIVCIFSAKAIWIYDNKFITRENEVDAIA